MAELLPLCKEWWSDILSCLGLLLLEVQRQSKQVEMMQSWRKMTAAPVAMMTGQVVHTTSSSSLAPQMKTETAWLEDEDP